MDTVPARHLLTPLRPSMTDFFYADYNMNLYRGCCHGCIYCDSRSLCYRLTEFDRVRVKADALTLLEKELRAKRRPGIVTMGAMSDPYNPHEATQKVTQGALTLFRRYGFGASFTTKAALCARDAERLPRYPEALRYAPVSRLPVPTTGCAGKSNPMSPPPPSGWRPCAPFRRRASTQASGSIPCCPISRTTGKTWSRCWCARGKPAAGMPSVSLA